LQHGSGSALTYHVHLDPGCTFAASSAGAVHASSLLRRTVPGACSLFAHAQQCCSSHRTCSCRARLLLTVWAVCLQTRLHRPTRPHFACTDNAADRSSESRVRHASHHSSHLAMTGTGRTFYSTRRCTQGAMLQKSVVQHWEMLGWDHQKMRCVHWCAAPSGANVRGSERCNTILCCCRSGFSESAQRQSASELISKLWGCYH
jgi:hypothetical protein